MILLDDTFLSEVGLAALPAGQRQALLQRIYEELELRVGTSLTDSLSDAQVEEFEALIDHDQTAVAAWLHSVVPNFTEDPLYMAMVEKLSAATPDAVVCEYAASKWLEVNQPDYRRMAMVEYERIKSELLEHADEILASLEDGRSTARGGSVMTSTAGHPITTAKEKP